MNLGGKELRDQWDALNRKLDSLDERYTPIKNATIETADDVRDAFKLLCSEIGEGFARIRTERRQRWETAELAKHEYRFSPVGAKLWTPKPCQENPPRTTFVVEPQKNAVTIALTDDNRKGTFAMTNSKLVVPSLPPGPPGNGDSERTAAPDPFDPASLRLPPDADNPGVTFTR